MGITIVTDSGSDLSIEEAAKNGIHIIPLSVNFGNDCYKDGVDLNHDTFFEKLIETDILPTTSQIPPFDYEEAFKKIIDKGNQILCITISSKLSGCYQSACIAAEEFPEKIRIVDSLNACIGERILVEEAAKLNQSGTLSLDELAYTLEEEKGRIKLIALLDTLEYLKKGGRINAATAIAGTVLNIKPVIAIEDGLVVLKGTARGSKNGNNKLKELIKNNQGINFDKPCALAYSGLSRNMLDKYLKDSEEVYTGHIDSIPTSSIGAVIGTHIGPGAIAAAFFV